MWGVVQALNPDDLFVLKVIQLEEVLAIRHCVFVMGPPGCGKSSSWKARVRTRRMCATCDSRSFQVLANARTRQGMKTKYVDLNPKSVGPDELYGYITVRRALVQTRSVSL